MSSFDNAEDESTPEEAKAFHAGVRSVVMNEKIPADVLEATKADLKVAAKMAAGVVAVNSHIQSGEPVVLSKADSTIVSVDKSNPDPLVSG